VVLLSELVQLQHVKMQLVEAVVIEFQLGLDSMDQHFAVSAQSHINQAISWVLLIAQSELQVLVDLGRSVPPVVGLVHDPERILLVKAPHESLVALSVTASHLYSAHICAVGRVGDLAGINLLQQGRAHRTACVAEQLVRSLVVLRLVGL